MFDVSNHSHDLLSNNSIFSHTNFYFLHFFKYFIEIVIIGLNLIKDFKIYEPFIGFI